MGKAKGKGVSSVQNRHIYTRASYLYQAATHLAKQVTQPTSDAENQCENETRNSNLERQAALSMSRRLLTDMKAVSQKAVIRHSPSLKRTVCKFCDTLQVEGETCQSTVQNPSKGGRKPWADLLEMECMACGHVKRYPVSAPRQKRRPYRLVEGTGEGQGDDEAMDEP